MSQFQIRNSCQFFRDKLRTNEPKELNRMLREGIAGTSTSTMLMRTPQHDCFPSESRRGSSSSSSSSSSPQEAYRLLGASSTGGNAGWQSIRGAITTAAFLVHSDVGEKGTKGRFVYMFHVVWQHMPVTAWWMSMYEIDVRN